MFSGEIDFGFPVTCCYPPQTSCYTMWIEGNTQGVGSASRKLDNGYDLIKGKQGSVPGNRQKGSTNATETGDTVTLLPGMSATL